MKVTRAGYIVDVFNRSIFKGEVEYQDGRILRITPREDVPEQYIMPGFVDAHVHIESSMLIPSRFARLVVPRGTVAVVSDPHEIANVLGERGVDYMIEDAKKVPLKMFFGAPSCVPATSPEFETSGAILDAVAVKRLLQRDDIWFLSEMMNFPGVLGGDPQVMEKLSAAQQLGKKIDGHAPGLNGESLKAYVDSGIVTDHECSTLKEAVEKIAQGMKIQIREGSAAKNFENLSSLLQDYPNSVMLCTDDSHPDELIHEGHLDKLIKRGREKGYDLFSLLRAASVVPVEHYGLPVGLLREGDSADFVVVRDLDSFKIVETVIDGETVFHDEEVQFEMPQAEIENNFQRESLSLDQIRVSNQSKKINVIRVFDGELLTNKEVVPSWTEEAFLESNIQEDILKIVVASRYDNSMPSVGFIKDFGLKEGALAGSIAHDSHNLVAVGASDEAIVKALNLVIAEKGGIAMVGNQQEEVLPLPVAGLMSYEPGEEVAAKYEHLNKQVGTLGTSLRAPFMTMAFMSLLVIPQIKMGDKGLFDVSTFKFISLFEE